MTQCGVNVFPRNKMSDAPELEPWIDVPAFGSHASSLMDDVKGHT